MGEDPPRKMKRSQIAGKAEGKTNSAPGHDGGINEESDKEGVEESDKEDEELDEQDEDNLDEQDVEEPDKEDDAVGDDGSPLPPPLVPVLAWDRDFVGEQAYS